MVKFQARQVLLGTRCKLPSEDMPARFADVRHQTLVYAKLLQIVVVGSSLKSLWMQPKAAIFTYRSIFEVAKARNSEDGMK